MRAAILLLLLVISVFARPDRREITLANGEWPPYQSEKLPYGGVASRIVTEAFTNRGIKVRQVFLPWKRAYEESRIGKIDGAFVWIKTPERLADFWFSEPVITTERVLFHHVDHPIAWQTLGDLRHLRIGTTLGYTYGPEFDSMADSGALQIERVPNDVLNLRKLAEGRIDAAPLDLDVGLFLLKNERADVASVIRYAPKPIQTEGFSVMISRKSANGEWLIQEFNAGLAVLRAQGKVARYLHEARSGLYPAGKGKPPKS